MTDIIHTNDCIPRNRREKEEIKMRARSTKQNKNEEANKLILSFTRKICSRASAKRIGKEKSRAQQRKCKVVFLFGHLILRRGALDAHSDDTAVPTRKSFSMPQTFDECK